MPSTYKIIQAITVGSGGSSALDFTSIPNTYTDLILKVSGRITTAAIDTHISLRFNNNSGNSYSFKRVIGNGAGPGTGASSYGETNETSMNFYSTVNGASSTTSTFSNIEFYIPNYASSNTKTISFDGVLENNAVTAYASIYAGLWNNTAAINQITLTGSANFLQHTTAYLYGVSNA